MTKKPQLKNRLDEIMWQERIKGSDLAEKLGVSRQYISNLKNDPSLGASIEFALLLSKALGKTVEDIFYIADDGEGQSAKIKPALYAHAL